MTRTTAALSSLENVVFSKRPVLGEVYRTQGDSKLKDFTRAQFARLEANFVPQERRDELIDVITTKLNRLVGEPAGKGVAQQLQTTYTVITADHHGPLTDPGFFNNDLLMHFSGVLPYILVLSCSNISFDNDSFPRGHLFHSLVGGEVRENQLVLFSRKVRPLTVLLHKSYTIDNVGEAKKRIDAWVREGSVTQSLATRLNDVLESVYMQPEVLSQPLFTDQVTVTNSMLWKKLLPSSSSKLLYLAQEEIVLQLLTAHLNRDSILHKILFDEKYQSLLLRYFDGIRGGFSTKEKGGTFLFWALPKDQKYRMQLWKKGKILSTNDGSYGLELTPSAIQGAFEKNELIPSTLLSFIVLAFYYGLVLIGGGGQTSYMTGMKSAYLAFCRESGDEEEMLLASAVSTTRQALPYPSLAFLRDPKDSFFPATPLDALLYGDSSSSQVFETLARNITVKQVLARQLPTLEHTLVSHNRDWEDVSVEEIDTITGFDRVLQSFGTLE